MKKRSKASPKFVVIDTSSPANEEAVQPVIKNDAPTYSKEELNKRGIIHPSMKDVAVLNAFRNLRTSMLPRMESYNTTLLVSSVVRGGGASFNAINIATAFTLDRQRTALLVDCNFHRPTLDRTLNVDTQLGLYDYLTGQTNDIAKIIYPTLVPRLRLVPCGKISEEDQSEFFTGERMRDFLKEVKNRYPDRIVMLDSPPVLDSADTTILSELVDYALLVIPYQGANASKVEKAIKAIGENKIVGFVMNK